jgi:hypothetical protein
MVITDALEGIIDSRLLFHYDIGNDVLYLRRADHRDRESFSEETPDGLLLRDEETDEPVGWTAVNWWKLLDTGSLPDSLGEITRHIESWALARSI